MLIETTAGDLRLALDKVKPAICRWVRTPILNCVLLRDGAVTATDLDFEITVKFAAKRFEGRVAIPFHPLNKLMRALPVHQDVRLQARQRGENDFGVYVTFDGGRYYLPSMQADDFPEWIEGGERIKCKAPETLLTVLEACRPFISTEETRYYLNGVCFSKAPDGRPVAVATDGHRMMVHDLDHGVDGGLILPRPTVAALSGLPVPHEIFHTGTKMDFQMPGARLRSKLIDGMFPDWTRVVPDLVEDMPELRFAPRKMQAVLKRMDIGLSRYGPRNSPCADICADPSGQTVVVTTKAQDGEECAERLEGAAAANWTKLTGGIVSFNARYLKQICQVHAQADTLILRTEGGGGPARISPEGPSAKSPALTVLMPMRGGNGLTQTALMAFTPASNDPGAAAQEVA